MNYLTPGSTCLSTVSTLRPRAPNLLPVHSIAVDLKPRSKQNFTMTTAKYHSRLNIVIHYSCCFIPFPNIFNTCLQRIFCWSFLCHPIYCTSPPSHWINYQHHHNLMLIHPYWRFPSCNLNHAPINEPIAICTSLFHYMVLLDAQGSSNVFIVDKNLTPRESSTSCCFGPKMISQ